MKTEKIVDKNKKIYTVEIDENSLECTTKETEREDWKVAYQIFDNDGIVGQGHFTINCKSNHKLSPNDILSELIIKGVNGLRLAIDGGSDVTSLGFVFNCCD